MSNKNNKLKWEEYKAEGEEVLEAIRKNVNNTIYLQTMQTIAGSGNGPVIPEWEAVKNENLDVSETYMYYITGFYSGTEGACFFDAFKLLAKTTELTPTTVLGVKNRQNEIKAFGVRFDKDNKRFVLFTENFDNKELKEAKMELLRTKIKLSIPD